MNLGVTCQNVLEKRRAGARLRDKKYELLAIEGVSYGRHHLMILGDAHD